jgi:hypothetical protein
MTNATIFTRYNFDSVTNFINEMTLENCEKCFLSDIAIGRTGYGQYNASLTFRVDGTEIVVKQHTTDSMIVDEDDNETQIGMILNLFDSIDVSEYIQEKI